MFCVLHIALIAVDVVEREVADTAIAAEDHKLISDNFDRLDIREDKIVGTGHGADTSHLFVRSTRTFVHNV